MEKRTLSIIINHFGRLLSIFILFIVLIYVDMCKQTYQKIKFYIILCMYARGAFNFSVFAIYKQLNFFNRNVIIFF